MKSINTRVVRGAVLAALIAGTGYLVLMQWGRMALVVALPLLLAPVLLGAVLAVLKRKVGRGLLRSDPTALLDWYKLQGERNPGLKAQFAAAAATVAALYELPAVAEEHLARVEWATEPPMARAGAEVAKALICYARADFQGGFNLARRAAAIFESGDEPRRAETSRRVFAMHVALGEVLAGSATQRSRDALRDGLAHLPLIGQLLSAWGLRALAASSDAGIDVRAVERFLSQRAPHCVLLRRLP